MQNFSTRLQNAMKKQSLTSREAAELSLRQLADPSNSPRFIGKLKLTFSRFSHIVARIAEIAKITVNHSEIRFCRKASGSKRTWMAVVLKKRPWARGLFNEKECPGGTLWRSSAASVFRTTANQVSAAPVGFWVPFCRNKMEQVWYFGKEQLTDFKNSISGSNLRGFNLDFVANRLVH